jgi:hypothetical protein
MTPGRPGKDVQLPSGTVTILFMEVDFLQAINPAFD